ncbi:hypothetical protein QDX21_03400 [Auritidibacter ignavus]|uniref:Uncharacterized protein n=1 Tax=Auritidibacter ignavus TaxID=678932 RepID=A0AAJ6AKU2_9MICC|nr:hypothetical protein [Auritidibacter ignavus]WGH93857.1 hypothetical protein QDX21_03400 [Auritidibacter ignavus]
MENRTQNQVNNNQPKYPWTAQLGRPVGLAFASQIRNSVQEVLVEDVGRLFREYISNRTAFRLPALNVMDSLRESLDNIVRVDLQPIVDALSINFDVAQFIEKLDPVDSSSLSVAMPSGRTVTTKQVEGPVIEVETTPPIEQTVAALIGRLHSLELEVQSLHKERVRDTLTSILVGWLIGKQLDWILEHLELDKVNEGPTLMIFFFQVLAMIAVEVGDLL